MSDTESHTNKVEYSNSDLDDFEKPNIEHLINQENCEKLCSDSYVENKLSNDEDKTEVTPQLDISENEIILPDLNSGSKLMSSTDKMIDMDSIYENIEKQEESTNELNKNVSTNDHINESLELETNKIIENGSVANFLGDEIVDNMEINKITLEPGVKDFKIHNKQNNFENLHASIDIISDTDINTKIEEKTSVNHLNCPANSEEVKNPSEIKVSDINVLKNEIESVEDKFVDILGNGLLTKRIITPGLGRETRPTHGDSVTIQYKGWNNKDELIDDREVSFVLGDGDMIQAFDLGICLAERHEEFELKTDARFAYGSYGWEPLVQPNEALQYRIKLVRVDDPPDYTTFSHNDRMSAADIKRERGNYLYRREEYSLAVNSYSRAVKIIETDPDYKKASTDPSKIDMYDLFVKVTNNLAAAQLKLESYDNVIETCNTILNYDASNVKALFRKGKSLTMKGNYDDALPILKRALELENSKLIAGELQRCYQLKRAEDEQRARVCRKMFGSSAKDLSNKQQDSNSTTWTSTLYKYSPYVGAVIIVGVSAWLATLAIVRSN